MPTNKNASFRYRVIDRCLRNKMKEWTLEDLIDEITEQLWEHFNIDSGVGKRTVEGDISIMRSDPPRGFAAPIVFKKGSYFYEDSDYSITDHPLIDEDVDNLRYAVDILKQFRGFPHFKDLEQIIHKIEGQASTGGMQDVVRFEYNDEAKGIKWLEPLYKACLERTVLKITYHSFKAPKPKNEVVHPYILKEYRNRWFLFGYNETLDFISIYGLERIKGIKTTSRKYNAGKAREIEGIHEAVIGVSVPADSAPVKIIFEAIPSQVPYLLTKPFHPSLKQIGGKGDKTRFSVYLIPNFELEQLLLSFGENITILEPAELRDKISGRLKQALSTYHPE